MKIEFKRMSDLFNALRTKGLTDDQISTMHVEDVALYSKDPETLANLLKADFDSKQQESRESRDEQVVESLMDWIQSKKNG